MAVALYRSTDPGAVQLDGQVGSLVAVLDAVLVAAGWNIAFTTTNIRAYRQPATADTALRAYLRVNDAGPGAAGGQEARIVGYESMTDVNTGTIPCPTVAQMANGLFVRKSATADATPRLWLAVADERTFYMWINTGDAASVYTCWMFGDFYSFVADDRYRIMIMGRAIENTATIGVGAGGDVDFGHMLGATAATLLPGHFVFRDASQAAGAVQASKTGDRSLNPSAIASGYAMQGNLGYKNAADSQIYTPPIRVTHIQGGNTVRGIWRGMYHWGHAIAAVSDGATFPGALDLAGKDFRVIKQGGDGGVWVVETSDTWLEN
jgi:hypothetical protein